MVLPCFAYETHSKLHWKKCTKKEKLSWKKIFEIQAFLSCWKWHLVFCSDITSSVSECHTELMEPHVVHLSAAITARRQQTHRFTGHTWTQPAADRQHLARHRHRWDVNESCRRRYASFYQQPFGRVKSVQVSQTSPRRVRPGLCAISSDLFH